MRLQDGLNLSQAYVVRSAIVSVMLLPLLGCRHKPPYVEPPPQGRWADIGKQCTSASPATELSKSLRDSLGNPFAAPGAQDAWAERASIARVIPGGWGGVTRPRKGLGSAIYLTDTTQRDTALAALLNAGVRYIARSSEVKQGRWTYDQLYDWFRYIHSHLRHVSVSMWALDEHNNRIFYGVEDDAAGLELDRQLTAMNVPCFLVAREVTGKVRLLQDAIVRFP